LHGEQRAILGDTVRPQFEKGEAPMWGRRLVPGRRAFVALAVASLAGGAVSAGSAYGGSGTVTRDAVVEKGVTFVCGGYAAASGFGDAKFIQNGDALTVKFHLINAPPNMTVEIEVSECRDRFDDSPIVHDLGTVTTNTKGEAKKTVSTTLDPGIFSYFLCLDGTSEWGTQPVPV
jgi:hypothetical protein